eukprot:gene4763-62101_t
MADVERDHKAEAEERQRKLRESLCEKIEQLYKAHRPAHVAHIAGFLARFPGKETEILALAERRFPAETDAMRKAEGSGVVKLWNEDRGFGFVLDPQSGRDLFVHRAFIGDNMMLVRGMNVWFNRTSEPRTGRPQALV